MKKILPGEKKATSPNISVNGSVTSDKRCIADAFNKFFTSAATRFDERPKVSRCPHPMTTLGFYSSEPGV